MKVVILSVPFSIPSNRLLAPALLSGCLNAAGIPSIGLDLNFSLGKHLKHKVWQSDLRSLSTLTNAYKNPMPMSANVYVLRFLINYLKDIREKYNPEWIGLSLFTLHSLLLTRLVIRLVRKYLPDSKIVLGGRMLELQFEGKCWYDIYDAESLVDLIIVGDAEISLVDAIKHDRRGLIKSPQQTQEDLDNIPFPNWAGYGEFPLKGTDQFIPITGSKGCVRHCTFCDVAAFWPKYIYRDGTKIADTIISNHRATGITDFRFTDNLINGSISHFRKMNERIVELLPNTIKYSGQAIFRSKKSTPEADFELAAAAGCELLLLGLESGSEKVRNDMKKKFSNDDLEYSAGQYYKNKIKQIWLFIVGYPTETEEDFQDTLRLIKNFAPMSREGLVFISVTHPFLLLPGSPLTTDPDISEQFHFSLDPAIDSPLLTHFWESSDENTFPLRVDRWRRFYQTVVDNGCQFSPKMDVSYSLRQLDAYERLYKENVRKYIPILKA